MLQYHVTTGYIISGMNNLFVAAVKVKIDIGTFSFINNLCLRLQRLQHELELAMFQIR